MEETSEISTSLYLNLAVPSGRCPHQLEGTDVESVRAWVKKLMSGKNPNVNYAKSVFSYWIRDTYDINGNEYKAARNSLDSVIKD